MQVESDRSKRIVFKEVPWSQKDECATFYHAHCNYNCMQYKLDSCLILHCLWQTVFKILVCKSEPIVLCYIMELKWFNMFVSVVNVRWCLTWRKFGFCPWGLTGSYTIRNWRAGDPFCKHVLLNCVVRSSLRNTSCQSMVHWLLLLPTFHGVLKGSDSFSAMTLLYILNISSQKLKLDKLWNKTHLHQVLARLDCECEPNLGCV